MLVKNRTKDGTEKSRDALNGDTSKQSKTKCHKANTNAKCTVGKCGTGNARYGRLITAGGSVRNSEEKNNNTLRNSKH